MAPLFVIALARRLPDTSMTVALASGGEEHFGWGLDRHMMADLYDALSTNTLVSGQWKKPPKFEGYPRPKEKATPKEKKPTSVAELMKMFPGGRQL